MRFQFKDPEVIIPNQLTEVIIRYQAKDPKQRMYPFQVGTGYYYYGSWHVNSNHLFHDYYEVTGWAHYPYTFKKDENIN